MRALLDSSVLIAAVISRAGTCATLLEDVLNDHEWITSDFILSELSRKLRDKFKYPENEIAEIREMTMIAAEFVTPVEIPVDACRDPNDLPILGTAIAGRAEIIITGDKDLLALETFRGIPIVRPGEFWKRLGSLWESPNTSSEPSDSSPSGGCEISNK